MDQTLWICKLCTNNCEVKVQNSEKPHACPYLTVVPEWVIK